MDVLVEVSERAPTFKQNSFMKHALLVLPYNRRLTRQCRLFYLGLAALAEVSKNALTFEQDSFNKNATFILPQIRGLTQQ